MNCIPRPIELLAPAKNVVIAKSAINCGADAVYIGAPQFGARSAASNSIEDIAELVDYAHRFNVRIFVTVNTVFKDDELKDVEKMIHQLYEVGVDAIIVQDMAVLRMNLPPIALHASTQCDIRTAEKARFLEDVGFSQIVLARELSLKEINDIHNCVSVPIEVFVHGALCVSYSGRCAVSCMLKGRSANRGECAQLCRLSYDLIDGNGNVVLRKKHLLSLRDMNQSRNIKQLLESGASSFKIEGRLKDAEYVCNVVSAYRNIIDSIISESPDKYCRSSVGASEIGFVPDLRKSFNRNYTDYFLSSRHPKYSMASFNTPKSLGEPVGRVVSVKGNKLRIDTDVKINNGDGLSYFNPSGEFTGCRANIVQGNDVMVLYPGKLSVRPGDMVYRTFDKDFVDKVNLPTYRKIAVNLTLSLRNDKVILTANDEREYSASVDVCDFETASKSQSESQKRVLSKVGDTIYSVGKLSVLDGCFIPSSKLANARREVLAKLNDIQLSEYRRDLRKKENYEVKFPSDTLIFSDNVANSVAEEFYRSHGVTSIEKAAEIDRNLHPGSSLMTTRYCLRREMGYCKKESRGAELVEPLVLRHDGMQNLRLHFDCKRCEMHVKLDSN